MPSEVIRWRGGPGAGKSSALLQYVQTELDTGRGIGDIAIMTFSRSQAADLAGRLHALLPDTPADEVLPRVATIDATALRACRAAGLVDDPRETVIQPDDTRKRWVYEEFMKNHGLEYDPTVSDDDDESTRANLPIGNALIALNGYLSATMRQPEEWQVAAANLGLSIIPGAWPIVDLLRLWDGHKAHLGVFEHADYVRLALDHELPPPAPILFVDEFQDVSPLQAALIGQWINHPDTRRVYVAGDEDQSIYGFRGCDPRLFLSLDAEDRGARTGGSRPTSHRCPTRIMDTAEMILGHPANVDPCGRRGTVAHVRPETTEDLARQVEEAIRYSRTLSDAPQVFILSRFKRGANSLARALSAAGIPCSGIKAERVHFWTATRIGRSWNTLEKTTISPWILKKSIARYLGGGDIDPISLVEAESLALSILPDKRREIALADLKAKAKIGPIRLGDIFRWTGGKQGDHLFDMLNLRSWIVDEIRACLAREARRGYAIPPDEVKIDTIHAAKGLESAVVLLHSKYLKGRLDDLRIPERRAEERRIYFVGATRASHALLITDYGDGPTCPILEGVGA